MKISQQEELLSNKTKKAVQGFYLKILLLKLKKTPMNEEIHHIRRLQDWILLKCYFFPQNSIESVKFSMKTQAGYFFVINWQSDIYVYIGRPMI